MTEELLKLPRCAVGSCAGPVAPGQTECISRRLHHPEGRKRLIAELRGDVAPAVVAPRSMLPESTLPPARSLWEEEGPNDKS